MSRCLKFFKKNVFANVKLLSVKREKDYRTGDVLLRQSIGGRTFTLVQFRTSHMDEVINLLLQISPFVPGKDHDRRRLAREYVKQPHVKSMVLVDDFGFVAGFVVLVLERKIRGGVLGHVEDVVVRKDLQGLGLGRIMMDYVIQKSSESGCYKLILTCSNQNVDFYTKLGFVSKGLSMVKLL